jgi:Tol biopolymer transport system component
VVSPRFSPDGQRLAFHQVDFAIQSTADLWTYDIRSSNLSRVTFDSASANSEWSEDGKHLLYAHGRAIMRITVDGSGVAETLLVRTTGGGIGGGQGGQAGELQISRDGKMLVYRDGGGGDRNVWVATRDTGWTIRPLLRTPFNERNLALSHDGRWLAYVSNESGSDEVYVRRLEEGSGRWKVSRNGGLEPRWGPMDHELFFRLGDSLVVTRMEPGPEPHFNEPRGLFGFDFDRDGNRPAYDISPDGTHFVFTRSTGAASVRELNVVLNWFDQFRKR